MTQVAAGVAIVVSLAGVAAGYEEPVGLRERFLKKIKADLDRIPDFVCSTTVERFSRNGAERPWAAIDTLRFDVAVVKNQELYSRSGSRQFENRPLSELIGRGSISTGQLAMFAKHVFVASAADITYKSEGERDGRRAYEFEYDVPSAKSSYRLRTGNVEAIVGFQGTFWIDAQTLDLLRLEIQPYDIPEKLGLAEASTQLTYNRTTIDEVEVLLPMSANLAVVAVDGAENMNRTRLTGCRHYRIESAIRFDGEAGAAAVESKPEREVAEDKSETADIPTRALLEMTLDTGFDPTTATVGSELRATVSKPVKDGERILIPQGSAVRGRLVRLEKQSMPFAYYEVGLEFDTLEMAGRKIPLVATMIDAGPASGLLKQQRRLDPTFTRQRGPRLNILVQEVQRGQGILNWDARKGAVPDGLKMKWRVME